MSRLSEILESIRPAGAPGASSDTEGPRASALSDREFASISSILAGFEHEADALVAAAANKAQTLRADAERRRSEIESGLPDRIAVAQSLAGDRRGSESDVERSAVTDQSSEEISRLRSDGAEATSNLVAAALDVIWASVEPTANRS